MIHNLKYGTYEVVEVKDTFVLYDHQFVNKIDADKYFYKLVQDKTENKNNLYNRVYLLEWTNDFKGWNCTKDWIYGEGYKINDIRVKSKSKFKIIKQLFIKLIVLRKKR